MMNTRCTKFSMVRDDSKSSKTSNKKCPVVLHGDHMCVFNKVYVYFKFPFYSLSWVIFMYSPPLLDHWTLKSQNSALGL